MGFKKGLRILILVFVPLAFALLVLSVLFSIMHWEGGLLLSTISGFGVFLSALLGFVYAIAVKPQRPPRSQFDFQQKSS